MTSLEDWWQFVAYRPGLSAAGVEWRHVLREDLWDTFRRQFFVGDGIATSCIHPNCPRPLHVVRATHGYKLVCLATGAVEADHIDEKEVRCYRLDLSAVRNAVAGALDIEPEPGKVRVTSRAFSLGEWQPAQGVALPAYLVFAPTVIMLRSEIQRLLLESRGGFLLLTPQASGIDQATRDRLDHKKVAVLALSEILTWDGVFRSTRAWQTYRDAYCTRHLPDRMVPAQPGYQFAKRNMWAIRFAGNETFLESSLKGPVFIRYLLERQGQEIHVARMLADIAGDDRLNQTGDAGKMVDPQAFAQCRQRYEELHEDREEAQRDHPERLPAIDAEISKLAGYFAQCIGLGGNIRKAADDVAKIRKRITRVIDLACEKIVESDPQLAEHLQKSIKTYTFMSYQPETRIDWHFD